MKIHQSTKGFKLKNSSYVFRVFDLGRELKDSPPPIPVAVGDSNEVWDLFREELSALHAIVGTHYVKMPFVFPHIGHRRFGDFTSKSGQSEFRRARLRLSVEQFRLRRPMQELRRFADLAQILRFPKSEECACLRNLSFVNDQLEFEIGPGPFEEVFATMNSQGLRFDVTDDQITAARIFWGNRGQRELFKLATKLRKQYGDVTVRQAIHKQYGGLPRFGDQVCSYVLGMAAVIVTEDGYAVFGRRAKHRVSLNLGVNVPTSGGLKFDRRELTRLGLPRFVEAEILREAEEEIGIAGSDCAVTVLALVREVWRAGSPEFLAMIEFYGTLNDLVNRMHENHHPEQDVDSIHAIPLKEALKIICEPDACKVLHPKALVTLIMLDRFRANGHI